jgi:hypothetical protein
LRPERGQDDSAGADGDYLKVEYSGAAVVHTEVFNPSGGRSGPGMAVVSGRLVMLPYGRASVYQGLEHPVRQAILQALLSEAAGAACPTFLRNTANIAVYDYDLGAKRTLLLVNASGDDYPEVNIACGGRSFTTALRRLEVKSVPVA